MARPRRDDAPDLSKPHELTAGLLERLACPPDKKQAFIRDIQGNGLRVRVTAAGAKSFVFERKLRGETIRQTIGGVTRWTIEEARAEARRLGVVLDRGADPRELEREAEIARKAAAAQVAAHAAAAKAQATAEALTFGAAWARYIDERRPHWGERNYADHLAIVAGGGEKRRRGEGVTVAGPLADFVPMRLLEVTPAVVERWAQREAVTRPARVRLGLRLLKAFLRWAAAEPDLKNLVDPTAASAKKTREAAGKAKPKNDVLQREQLCPWFDSVRGTRNQVIAAYLQCLLLTGARREELAALRWADVNFKWRSIAMRDKIEGQRMVPLTPYVAHLLSGLPRRNEWVFSSARAIDLGEKNAARRAAYHERQGTQAPQGDVSQSSASGRLVEPSIAHRQACMVAGIEGLTLHGLRRSFASLCEWLDIPGGISAQIQGHAPQGVREQNYIRRPLDLLRVHHEKIEAWMLEQAGIAFKPLEKPGVTVRAI